MTVDYGSVPLDWTPLKGMRVRVSPQTMVTLVELDYFADPEKAVEGWLDKATQGMPEADVEREYKRNRTLALGDAFYFEFQSNGGRKSYVYPCRALVEGLHVSRSFDFGVRRPVCVWYQYDPFQDRVWYLREFMARDCGTHDFRDVVLYLSGEKPYEELTGDALYWADEVGSREWNPPPPWFGQDQHFVNFAGNEAFRRQAAAMKNPQETTDADILAVGGIHLVEWNGPVQARSKIMRRLLKIRMDRLPGALFDPACEELIRTMMGGLTFHKATAEDPIQDKPRKDGHFDNLHDGATYGPAHEVPAADQEPMPLPKRVSFVNRLRVEEEAGDSLPWKEVKHGW